MSNRKSLPNELHAEIVDAMRLRDKFARIEHFKAAKKLTHSAFDRYVIRGVEKSPITLTNCWDSENCNANLALSDDRLTIAHKGTDGYGSACSKLPVPKNLKHGMFYFEVLVKKGGIVNIGLSAAGPRLPFIVGYGPGSCSYDDTGKFVVARKSYDYGPSYRNGDLIGCGVHLASRQLFFVHNGQFLGIATVLPNSGADQFPTITLLDSTIVETNFGRQPFAQFTLDPKIMGNRGGGPKRWHEAEMELQNVHQEYARQRPPLFGDHNQRLAELMARAQQEAMERSRLEREHRELELEYRQMRRQFGREKRRLATMRERLDKMVEEKNAGPSNNA